MMKVNSLERYNTSHGLAFIVDGTLNCTVGQKIEIDGNEYVIERIVLPTKPHKNLIALFVR